MSASQQGRMQKLVTCILSSRLISSKHTSQNILPDSNTREMMGERTDLSTEMDWEGNNGGRRYIK